MVGRGPARDATVADVRRHAAALVLGAPSALRLRPRVGGSHAAHSLGVA